MRLSGLRTTAAISVLFAGYLGLGASAQAQLCPPALLPNQQDGICITDQTVNPNDPTRVLFQTAADAPTQEIFFSNAGLPTLPNLSVGYVVLTNPNDITGIPGITLPGATGPNVSDILAVRINPEDPASIDIAFISDSVTQGINLFNLFATGLPLLGSIRETGDWQDVSSFFTAPASSVFVQSDIEAVPEPASLTLLGSALLGLGWAARRRKQS